jgi:hypothetical protein
MIYYCYCRIESGIKGLVTKDKEKVRLFKQCYWMKDVHIFTAEAQ